MGNAETRVVIPARASEEREASGGRYAVGASPRRADSSGNAFGRHLGSESGQFSCPSRQEMSMNGDVVGAGARTPPPGSTLALPSWMPLNPGASAETPTAMSPTPPARTCSLPLSQTTGGFTRAVHSVSTVPLLQPTSSKAERGLHSSSSLHDSQSRASCFSDSPATEGRNDVSMGVLDFLKHEIAMPKGELECIASGFLSLSDYEFIAGTLKKLSVSLLSATKDGEGNEEDEHFNGRTSTWQAFRTQVINFHVESGGDDNSCCNSPHAAAVPLARPVSPSRPGFSTRSMGARGPLSNSSRTSQSSFRQSQSMQSIGVSMNELLCIAEKDEALSMLLRKARQRLPRVQEMQQVMPPSATLNVLLEAKNGTRELLHSAFLCGPDVQRGVDSFIMHSMPLTARYMERFVSGLPVWINSRLGNNYTSPTVPIISPFLTCGVHTSRRKEFFVSFEERVDLLRGSSNPFETPEEILLCIGQLSSYVSNVASSFSLAALLAISAETCKMKRKAKTAACEPGESGSGAGNAATMSLSHYASLQDFTVNLCKRFTDVNSSQFESIRRRYPNAFALSTLLCEDEGPLPVLGVVVSLLVKLVFLFAGGINTISADDRRGTMAQFARAQDLLKRKPTLDRAHFSDTSADTLTEDVALATALHVKSFSRITEIAKCMHLESSYTGLISPNDAVVCANVWRTLYQYVGVLPSGAACPHSMLDWIRVFPLYAVDDEAKSRILFVHSLLAHQQLLSIGPVMRENVLQCTSVLLHRTLHNEHAEEPVDNAPSQSSTMPSYVVFPTFATRRWGLETGEGHGPRKDLYECCAVESWSLFLPSVNVTGQITLGLHKGDIENLATSFPEGERDAIREKLRAHRQKLIVLVNWKEKISFFSLIRTGDEVTLVVDTTEAVQRRSRSLSAEVETAVEEHRRLRRDQERPLGSQASGRVFVAHPPPALGLRIPSPRARPLAAQGSRSGGSTGDLRSPTDDTSVANENSSSPTSSPDSELELLSFHPYSVTGVDSNGDESPAPLLSTELQDDFAMSKMTSGGQLDEDYIVGAQKADTAEGSIRAVVLDAFATKNEHQQIVVLNLNRDFDRDVTGVVHHRKAMPAFTIERGSTYAWTNPQFHGNLVPKDGLVAEARPAERESPNMTASSGIPFTIGWLLGNALANGLVFQAPLAPLAFRILSRVVKFGEPVEEINLTAADLTLVNASWAANIIRSAMLHPESFFEMYDVESLGSLSPQELPRVLRHVIQRVSAEALWNVEGDEERSRAFWSEVVRGLRSTFLASTPLFTNCCARTLRRVVCGCVDNLSKDFSFKMQFLITFDWEGTQTCYRGVLQKLTLDALEEGWTTEEKRQLLRFITGRSLLPHKERTEFIHVTFTGSITTMEVSKVPSELKRLPTSHSCSNLLELPNYLEYLLLEATTNKAPFSIQRSVGPALTALWENLSAEERTEIEFQYSSLVSARLRTAITESDTYEEEPQWLQASGQPSGSSFAGVDQRQSVFAAFAERRRTQRGSFLSDDSSERVRDSVDDSADNENLFAHFTHLARGDMVSSVDASLGYGGSLGGPDRRQLAGTVFTTAVIGDSEDVVMDTGEGNDPSTVDSVTASARRPVHFDSAEYPLPLSGHASRNNRSQSGADRMHTAVSFKFTQYAQEEESDGEAHEKPNISSSVDENTRLPSGQPKGFSPREKTAALGDTVTAEGARTSNTLKGTVGNPSVTGGSYFNYDYTYCSPISSSPNACESGVTAPGKDSSTNNSNYTTSCCSKNDAKGPGTCPSVNKSFDVDALTKELYGDDD